MSVEQLLSDWLAAQTSRGSSPNTVAMYNNVAHGWVIPHIGGLPISQLTASRAQRLVETLRSNGRRQGSGGLSNRSVQLALQVLKAATRWAAETGIVSRDPLTGYRCPLAKTSAAASSAWSSDEARAFLVSVGDDRLRAAWWLLLTRGLRRGELAGLRWAQVDLEAGVARIVETRVVINGNPASSTPKTAAGRRAVPLDNRLVSELKSLRTRQRAEAMVLGVSWDPAGFLFVDELGEPYRPETISRRFKRLTVDAGLRQIRLHDLRHTAASLMLAAGENTKVVAEILGHSSPSITQNIYQHVMPGMSEAAGQRLTSLLTDRIG